MDFKMDASKEQFKELLASPKGKGLAAGLILVVVLLVIVVVSTFAFPKPQQTTALPVAQAPAPQVSQQSTQTAVTTTDTAAAETSTAQKDIDVGEYRDPFTPIPENTGTAIGSGAATSTGSNVYGDVPQTVHVLSLESITEHGGTRYANVVYLGTQYEVKAGDQIGTSPYKVTDVADTSVTLLFGDDRLSLQLGEEILK
ncbi:MAG TPA: hypothetical protein VGK02_02185 [Candidatus Aquicultor sp.]